ncbi:DNA ligase 4 [Armillaria nabsnona]|nr:DNA ligase 4 [Armillaria nabsnona]
MMQPTPAPTSAPGSPQPAPEESQVISMPEPPQNVGSAPFGILVGLFERLQIERRRDKREKLLSSWFNHWRDEKGKDLYPVLRLLLPQKDRERSTYGLKEQKIAKTYIKLIPLGPRDPDAIRLTNWKKPVEQNTTSGDFPTILYEVVGKRSSVTEGSLSIDDLNEILDELSQKQDSMEVQSKILRRIYNRATPEEQKWIARIILKDLVISVKETTVFAVFHPDAQDLYNTCSDLKKVAWTLWDPLFRLNANDKTVALFHSFAPMLCRRPTKKIEETVKEMNGSEFIIEEKLDGERMQLHKKGNEYYYCSRKGKDYTYLYGKHVGTGSLTPYIDAAFDERVDELILDGEMLVWDPVSQRNLPFGTLKTAAGDKSKKAHMPRPCFKVFDLLYLNGQSLIDKTTKFRKRNMRACLKEVKGRIEFVAEFTGRDAQHVRQRMDEVMEARGEGLVIKHPKSMYVLNGRNRDWIKVKPEYLDNMGETVDVLVVAANYGTGSRGGGVSTLICAVIDDRHPDSLDEEPKYSSFVRIGSGLTYADYVWVRGLPWKPWNPLEPPEFYQTAKKTTEDKGDVYLEPEDSFILKVKAAEITQSDQYHLGYTMRFPRALSIRQDLTIADCMTASAVLESARTVKKRKMESDITTTTKKKTGKAKAKPMMLPAYQGIKTKDVFVESDIFNGLTFVVMPDPKSRTGEQQKKDLMKLIIANGGRCQQLAAKHPNLFIVYGGTITPYDLKLSINKGIHDMVKPEWITDSVALGRQAPLSKRYFFHATESRKATAEYSMEDDVKKEEDEMAEPTGEINEAGPSAKVEEQAEKIKHETIDPVLAEWLGIDTPRVPADDDSETEDDDDDNDSVNADAPGQDDMDDWLKVEGEDAEVDLKFEASDEVANSTDDVKELDEEKSRMGEDESAMEYDLDLIFKHLCFYLDTSSNARRNGMTAKSKYERVIDASFEEVEKLIISNGGGVVDLDEPKLTHVVIDKRDDSRRLELMRRTAKPKRKYLILSNFIQSCLDEATLLPEEEFSP